MFCSLNSSQQQCMNFVKLVEFSRKVCVSINFPDFVAGRPKHETCRNKLGGGGSLTPTFVYLVGHQKFRFELIMDQFRNLCSPELIFFLISGMEIV